MSVARNAVWSLRGYIRVTEARSQQGISGAYDTHLLLKQQNYENVMFTSVLMQKQARPRHEWRGCVV